MKLVWRNVFRVLFVRLLPACFSPLLCQTCMRMPTQLSCILTSLLVIWPGMCERRVHVSTLYACVSVGSSPFQAGLSRTSWSAVQGTTVPPDPRAVGDPGWRWHGHKSTDTEHVEAFRRQTHHLLPTGMPPLSLPSSTAAPFLSVKSKLFPWK